MAVQSRASKVVVEEEKDEGTVYEKKYGFVPKTTPMEQAVLHVEFPLEAYWRKSVFKKKIGERIVNVEGLIYPSFSDVVFTAEYKIEMINEKEFLIHRARGYAPCPVCGRNIVAVLEDYKWELERPISRFTPEVAYEIVISALSKEISYRLKNHIKARHGLDFERAGKTRVLIVRYVGGEEVVTEANITYYRCPYDGATRIIGVNGVLDHIVNHHANTSITKKIMNFIEKLGDTTKEIFGLGKENIPLLGAHRNTFSYVLVNKGSGKDTYRVLDVVYFKPWLHMRAVERKNRVDLIVTANIPRPMRLIYHYPLFRYVPHVIAYKLKPEYYMAFMNRVRRVLKRRGYPTTNLDKIVELVTGGLVYTDITPKHAFNIDLDTLESLRSKIAEIGEDVKVFLSHKVV